MYQGVSRFRKKKVQEENNYIQKLQSHATFRIFLKDGMAEKHLFTSGFTPI